MFQLVAVLFVTGTALGAPSTPLEDPYIFPLPDGKLLSNLATLPPLKLPPPLSPILPVGPERFRALTNIVVPNSPDYRPVMIRVDGEPAPMKEFIKVEEPKIEEVKELDKNDAKVEEKDDPEEKKADYRVKPEVVSYIPIGLTPYHPMYRGWLSDFQGTLQGLKDKWQYYINNYFPALTSPPPESARYIIY